jgi:hypothetical protein
MSSSLIVDLAGVLPRVWRHWAGPSIGSPIISDDAQDIEDEVWLAHGLEQGWSPMCKDGRIKGRDVERAPLESHGGVLFYLDNQRLLVAEMIDRFHHNQQAIYRAVDRGGPRTYAVGATEIRATWP